MDSQFAEWPEAFGQVEATVLISTAHSFSFLGYGKE
jgi:hypothetical protein